MGTRSSGVVFGSLVLDYSVGESRPYQTAKLFGKKRAIEIAGSKILVKSNAYLSVPYKLQHQVVRLVFRLPAKTCDPGDKITAIETIVVPWGQDEIQFSDPDGAPPKYLSQVEFPTEIPGGGGTNVGYVLYNVFNGMPRRYIATYSKEQDSVIDDALASVWGDKENLVLLKDLPDEAANTVIEFDVHVGDRLIVRATQKRDIKVRAVEIERGTDVCMVNTCYAWQHAVQALTEALVARVGVFGCTESLCDKAPIPEELSRTLAEHVNSRLELEEGDAVKSVQSVHKFVRTVVLPRAKQAVYLFNEKEFEHFFEDEEISNIVAEGGEDETLIYPNAIFAGFRKFRQIELGDRGSTVVVTCGRWGAFALDSENGVHHCNVLTPREAGRIEQQRNAIGDLFAAVAFGLIYGGVQRRSVEISAPDSDLCVAQSWVPNMLVCASAASDAGVYDGFFHVTPSAVASYLPHKEKHYSYLGKLNELPRARELKASLGSFLNRLLPGFVRGRLLRQNIPDLRNLVDDPMLLS